jgi:hypothetical protein
MILLHVYGQIQKKKQMEINVPENYNTTIITISDTVSEM